MRYGLLVGAAIALAAGALAQDGGDFDACGVLETSGGCVLFVGGGGSYVIVADAAGFEFGDTVRCVGTLDTGCTTICPEADGCISGATLYDPAVFPCGTHLPDFSTDVVEGTVDMCVTASLAATAMILAGLWMTAPGRVSRRR